MEIMENRTYPSLKQPLIFPQFFPRFFFSGCLFRIFHEKLLSRFQIRATVRPMTQTTQRHEPITETEARYIVMTRLQEPLDNGGKLSTLEDFSKALYQDGVVRRRYSARTLDNILKGRTYPLLTVPCLLSPYPSPRALA